MNVLTSTVAVLGFAGLMTALTSPASAGACAPHDEFAKHLAMSYQEQSEGVGVANDGSIFEIFASENGTWSLLITDGRKISCIVAAGDMWMSKPPLGPEASIR